MFILQIRLNHYKKNSKSPQLPPRINQLIFNHQIVSLSALSFIFSINLIKPALSNISERPQTETVVQEETEQEAPIKTKEPKRGRPARVKSSIELENSDKSHPSKNTKSEQKSANLQQIRSQTSQTYELKFAKQWQILKSLQNHTMINPFTSPVDEKRDCAPNYYSIIKKPMDLATIQDKLKSHTYQDTDQFHEDIKQMWKNSHLFNKAGSAMIKLTIQLEKYYENLRNGKKLKGNVGDRKGIKRR